jgi:hypothetical protein
MPRHRFRSALELVVLVGVVGLTVAVTVGGLAAALALALRAAVD